MSEILGGGGFTRLVFLGDQRGQLVWETESRKPLV